MSLKNIRFLLADDDEDDRDLFTEAVAEVNPAITVQTVRDGEELMEVLHLYKGLPDIIFLDVNMPRKNGKECLLEIQNDKKLSDIPVLIYSTSIGQKDVNEQWSAHASCFIRKPNSYAHLKDIIQAIIAHDFTTQEEAPQEPVEKIFFNLQ